VQHLDQVLNEEAKSEVEPLSSDLVMMLASMDGDKMDLINEADCRPLTFEQFYSNLLVPAKIQSMSLSGPGWIARLQWSMRLLSLKERCPTQCLPRIKTSTLPPITATTARGPQTVGAVEAEGIQEEEVGVVTTEVARGREKSGAQNGGMRNLQFLSFPSGLINEVGIQQTSAHEILRTRRRRKG